MSNEGQLDFKVPGNKKVNLALFWASNFFGAKDKDQIAKAESMLGEHGMGLNCWPSNKTKSTAHTFDFGAELIKEEQYTQIYQALTGAKNDAGKRDHLIVLFCQFLYSGQGITITKGPNLCFRTPMVFVSASPGDDGATLLHEVGHAAGMDHDKTSTGKTGRNFLNEAESRSTMMKWQLEKLAKATFVS
jgi:hypothetical protein